MPESTESASRGQDAPPGTVSHNLNSSQIVLYYGDYRVEAFPGIPQSEASKTCNVRLSLTPPRGYRIGIRSAQFDGFADLLNSSTVGTIASQYSFQGQSGRGSFFLQGRGDFFDNFKVYDSISDRSVVYGPCGRGTLNINTQIQVRGTGIISEPSYANSFRHAYGLIVKRC